MGSGVFRYFVADNLALGINAGGFYRSNGTKSGDNEVKSTDAGFIGSVSLAYYASLGGGMFIAPLVGGGFFAGSREATLTGTTATGDPLDLHQPRFRLGRGGPRGPRDRL